MQIGPSLEREGPRKGTPPHQTLNSKCSLRSKLTLAPTTSSYLAIAFFTASMSKRWDTKTMILTKTETLTLKRPTKWTSIRAGFAFLFLSLRSRSSKTRMWRRGDRGQFFQTDCLIEKDPKRFPFTCTTVWELRYRMLIHLQSSSWILWSPKPSPKTDVQSYRKNWTDLNWSERFNVVFYSP